MQKIEFKPSRTKRRNLAIASALTLAIVLVLVMLPLQASALTVTISGSATVDKPNTVCLTTTLTFHNGERIPIANIQAIISGDTDITVEFDTDGVVSSVTGDLNASQIGASITKIDAYDYAYGNMTGYEGEDTYAFGFGYGYSADDTVVRYVICFDSQYLIPGDHNLRVKVNTGMSEVKEYFQSTQHAFHVNGTALTLTVGWNECTWNRPAATLQQIEAIIPLGGFGSNEALSKWNNTTKAYQSWISGLGGDNPTVNPGDPVWIGVQSEKPFEM